MKITDNPLISIVVPVYNEGLGISLFHAGLVDALKDAAPNYEIIYCDDGSNDNSAHIIGKWCIEDARVKLMKLSRNFGKEIATTAGIHKASGAAIITLDADGQHPPELIADFISHWRAGDKVVIGLRTMNQNEGFIKRFGSYFFYMIFNRVAGVKLEPRSTDFRLIDRSVQQEFIPMSEHNRITRGLIDWLGYKRSYIPFRANQRLKGTAAYSVSKLFKLAIDSIISLSTSPLYLVAYIGAIVLPVSLLLGVFMLCDAVLGDPAHLHATGGAYVVVLILSLVGVLLVSQGITGLYLSHIHAETQNRPLFIIDRESSIGIDDKQTSNRSN
jgi:glycosyltransferase involved in cell wall biosynthesis